MVVAAALGSSALVDHAVRLHAVRGQVTWGPHDEDASQLPPFPVNGNGHFLPRVPLVDRGLVPSRERAQAMIIAGKVLANEQKIEKPGTPVQADVSIRLLGDDLVPA